MGSQGMDTAEATWILGEGRTGPCSPTDIESPTCTAPKVGEGTRVLPPPGRFASSNKQLFCFAWTVCGWWLGAVWQCPPRALEADSPWQGGWLATSPSQGQRPCRFNKRPRPPASINYRGWGGRRRANCTLLKCYLHLNVNQQIFYIQRLL